MFKSKVTAKYNVEDYRSLAARCMREFFSEYDVGLPAFKIVRHTAPQWYGRTLWSSAKPDTTTIELQARILSKPDLLERVLLHELIHHVDLIVNSPKDPAYLRRWRMLRDMNDGHGEFFMEKMNKINAVRGADYVKVKMDLTKEVDKNTKQFYILIVPYDDKLGYTMSMRLSPKQEAHIERAKQKGGVLVQTTDDKYLYAPKIGSGKLLVPKDAEEQKDLKVLLDSV